jgi:hypothetical protein
MGPKIFGIITGDGCGDKDMGKEGSQEVGKGGGWGRRKEEMPKI